MNSLTVSNCISYLNSMSFTEIKFTGERYGNYYFYAIDNDDDTQKEIEFEPMDNDRICVSVKLSVNDPFVILEILED